MDTNSLSDLELRESLEKYGVDVGPVTATTRRVYEKRLSKHLYFIKN